MRERKENAGPEAHDFPINLGHVVEGAERDIA